MKVLQAIVDAIDRTYTMMVIGILVSGERRGVGHSRHLHEARKAESGRGTAERGETST